MKTKLLIFLLLSLNIVSCVQSKIQSTIFIENYIVKKNKDISNIYISEKSIKSNENVLKIYKTAYNLNFKKDSNDSIYKHFKRLTSTKQKKWNSRDFSNKIKIIDEFKNREDDILFRYNLFRSKGAIIYLSKPIFNKDNTQAMFYYRKVEGIDDVKSSVIVLEKKFEKWVVIDEVGDNTLY